MTAKEPYCELAGAEPRLSGSVPSRLWSEWAFIVVGAGHVTVRKCMKMGQMAFEILKLRVRNRPTIHLEGETSKKRDLRFQRHNSTESGAFLMELSGFDSP